MKRPAPLPIDEERRLTTLASYALLDTSPEGLFDVFAELARKVCGAPIGLISLVDRDRVWFKAARGIEVLETSREVAFCAYTILTDGVFEVEDTTRDPRFDTNPFVQGEQAIRFYAGAPLRAPDGHAIGTVCVVDREPRTLTPEQRTGLAAIAEAVVGQLEAREREVPEQAVRDAQLAMQNERLTAITSIARTLFASLEPTLLVESLLAGVCELVEGEATLYAPRQGGGFYATLDLGLRNDAAPGDTFVALASRSELCVLDDTERRAAVRVQGSGGSAAYVLDVRRETPFSTADVFALGLLVQYFAVATRNVELYQELASRRDAVVELNQIKNDLIAMLAHDFKGPLTTIVGFADVLADDDRFDAEARQYLGMISSSAMRLASLATDTLALSRLEQNELALTLGEVDLVRLVRDVVRVFTVTRPIDLRAPNGVLTVTGDEARLRQVVENLVGNAIKYSPGGEPIEVALRARPGGVEVAVRDRGIGIPDTERGKLFGRFARASNARALGIGGTGFGLYLSKTIVELHGGAIEVESVEGQGSVFRVFVPVHAARHAGGSRRLLLLDADGDARSYVAHVLRHDGFPVTVAAAGEELLNLLEDAQYDAVLVDADRLKMPAESFIDRVGRRSALVRIGLRPPPEHHGWDALVTKPFLMKDLYTAIDDALDHLNGGASKEPASSAGSL